MIIATTSSAEETRALAASLAELVRPGDVVLLGGDLGAGKTTFTQGLGRALGVKEPITSPTFTLVRQYESASGRPHLLHADVYRLDQLAHILDLGLAELVEEGSVAVVEWGERAAPAFGPDHLEVQLTIGGPESASGAGGAAAWSEDERTLRFQPAGPRWAPRARVLAAALAPWRAVA